MTNLVTTNTEFVPWADYFRCFKQVQEYQSILAVAGLKRFIFDPGSHWVNLNDEIVAYSVFLGKVNPAHRSRVDTALEACLKHGQPIELLFDAAFEGTATPSAYRLRAHAPAGVVLGVLQLAYRGLAMGDAPSEEHLARLVVLALEQRITPLTGVALADALVTKVEPIAESSVAPSASPLRAPAPVRSVSPNLMLYYQPQSRIEPKSVTGFEVFLRQWDPQRGLVSPDQFLSGMEASGELADATEWLVCSALTHLLECERQVRRPLRLTLNLAPSQLQDARFIEHLAELVTTHAPGKHDSIALDIPISVLALSYRQADWERLLDLMALMTEKSFSPILEGYGHPSMALLSSTRVPLLAAASELKINVSHFRGLDFNTHLGLIGREAASQHLTLAAHGVEDADTLASLKFMKVQTYQGNLLAAPMPIEALQEFLKHNR